MAVVPVREETFSVIFSSTTGTRRRRRRRLQVRSSAFKSVFEFGRLRRTIIVLYSFEFDRVGFLENLRNARRH